jgi:hypothetical protein
MELVPSSSILYLRYLTAGGTYVFSNSDSETTVTELIVIANPASSGLKVIPKKGYNIPAATGISAVL